MSKPVEPFGERRQIVNILKSQTTKIWTEMKDRAQSKPFKAECGLDEGRDPCDACSRTIAINSAFEDLRNAYQQLFEALLETGEHSD